MNLEDKITKASEELEGLREEYRILGEKVSEAYDRHQALIEERFSQKVKTGGLTIPEMLDGTQNSSILYNVVKKFLHQYSLDSFGYHTETKQRCIYIYFSNNSNKDFEKISGGIKLLMPHLIPTYTSDDGEEMYLFEFTIDVSNGVYYIGVTKDHVAQIINLRHRNYCTVGLRGNLLDVMAEALHIKIDLDNFDDRNEY